MAQFLVGLLLCALGVWLSLQADLGLAPWDVLHAGVSAHTGLTFGTVTILVGVLVLTASTLLGVRPGLGTLVCVIVVGITLDWLISKSWLDDLPNSPPAIQLVVLVTAIGAMATGVALYIGPGYGAGPRDSLMVAFHRFGMPLGLARGLIEVSVLITGSLLGGPVGIGTALLALATGPAVQVAFRLLGQKPRTPGDVPPS